MVAGKIRVGLFSVIGVYVEPCFAYHQSLLVPVDVDINALVKVSQLNTFISPHFSVSRENLVHFFMVLKMKGNDDA